MKGEVGDRTTFDKDEMVKGGEIFRRSGDNCCGSGTVNTVALTGVLVGFSL